MDHVVARNEKGKERKFSLQVWNLMASAGAKGDTRKGWTLIQRVNGEPVVPVPTQAPEKGPTFIPEEIAKAETEKVVAEERRATEMISGEPQPDKPAEADPAPKEAVVAAPAAETPPVAPKPAPEPPKAAPVANGQVKTDDFTKINGTGEKVDALLKAAGILTYKQLADAQPTEIGKVLDAGGLGPKRAMVPAWKMKAAELAKSKA